MLHHNWVRPRNPQFLVSEILRKKYYHHGGRGEHEERKILKGAAPSMSFMVKSALFYIDLNTMAKSLCIGMSQAAICLALTY